MRDLGRNDAGPLHGVSPTIMYLQQLSIDHFDLILKYSSWVFEKDPEQGMQVKYRRFFLVIFVARGQKRLIMGLKNVFCQCTNFGCGFSLKKKRYSLMT